MNPMTAGWLARIPEIRRIKTNGRVQQVIGLTIESSGPQVKMGDICLISPLDHSAPRFAEVVGFREHRVLLMPLGELGSIGPGSEVIATGSPLMIQSGPSLLGRVLDGLGQPLDGLGAIRGGQALSITSPSVNPLTRPRIRDVLSTGVRSIDSLLTVGRGQRLGLFAGSGVGKSTLLGMIARNTAADINVIALIGERGRELLEFIEKDLGPKGLSRSVVVVATSDQPPLVRIKGAMVASAIAESFREQGYHVNLMMDSVTRFAMAQREVGLAIGEPPTTRGYTPSVFAMLPRLLERAGTSQRGSITAFYTVLVDGDDMNEPIADAVRGILDGHIVLRRELANQGIYPAIDILSSISRVMNDLVTADHLVAARNLKRMLAVYKEAEDLIHIGAYQHGSNALIDQAISLKPVIDEFLRQSVEDPSDFDTARDRLQEQFGGQML